jgi:aerobic carbon-monoxide dehydrogenase medium subunit
LKPGKFKYLAPTDLDECLAQLAEHGDEASLLGGGQSLLPLMSLRIARPEVLVDLNRLPNLDGLAVSADGVSAGALRSWSATATSPG